MQDRISVCTTLCSLISVSLNHLCLLLTFQTFNPCIILSLIIAAAALVEAGWDRYVNELWTVFVPRDEALDRILNRDGFTKEHVSAIVTIFAVGAM